MNKTHTRQEVGAEEPSVRQGGGAVINQLANGVSTSHQRVGNRREAITMRSASMSTVASRGAGALRAFSRRLSSQVAVTGESTQVQLSKEGLAELTRTLPIHKYGQDQLIPWLLREGANVRAARPVAPWAYMYAGGGKG